MKNKVRTRGRRGKIWNFYRKKPFKFRTKGEGRGLLDFEGQGRRQTSFYYG